MLAAIQLATVLVALSSSISIQVSRPAPRLSLEDIEGRTVELSNYKGKVVLLNFWATWCAPCRAEMLDLIEWQREHGKRGLQILGITYPPNEIAETRAFIRDIGVNYPILIGDESTKEQFDKGDVLPLTVVIDRKGRVREVIQGVIFPEEFEERVKPILEE